MYCNLILQLKASFLEARIFGNTITVPTAASYVFHPEHVHLEDLAFENFIQAIASPLQILEINTWEISDTMVIRN